MIQTWKITGKRIKGVRFDDESSLDVITRQIPKGYYSTFRTYGACTRVIGLSAHLRRLPNLDASSLLRQLIQLLEYFRTPSELGARRGETADEVRVRVMMTFNGQVYISIEPLKKLPPEIYEKGVCVETTPIHRDSPRMKSTAFIDQSKDERKQIAQKGVFEALLVKNGKILEGMTSNFFYVQNGVLYTAQRDILLGVTRKTIIHVARRRGVDVMYMPLKQDQLSAVKEAFLTSSTRGIVPVIQIDTATVGEGRVGSVTKMLMSAYDEYVLAHAERIDQGT